MDVKVSKEAAEELEEAAAWYEAEQPGLGRRLIDAFEHAIQLLREPSPPLTPVLGGAAELGGNKLILHRFPFFLIIVRMNNTMNVIAFAHHAGKPRCWAERNSPLRP